VLETFDTGKQPASLAFDGANIWVAPSYENTVIKLRANDGAVLGAFGVGDGTHHLVFDGANIWVTGGGLYKQIGSGQYAFWDLAGFGLTELRASDGKAVLSLRNIVASDLVFDGTDIWVTEYNAGTVIKLRTSDGKQLGSFAVGPRPGGVLFDGTNIWVANREGGSVTKLRANDGTVLGTFFLASFRRF
jgi:outer membrane protein assembly factor BamB